MAATTGFGRIDHGGNAAENGLSPRPKRLLIFGNPKGGTPLTQLRQTAGIDFLVKAPVRNDEEGRTWLTCNDAFRLAERHQIDDRAEPLVEAIMQGMAKMSQVASQPLGVMSHSGLGRTERHPVRRPPVAPLAIGL